MQMMELKTISIEIRVFLLTKKISKEKFESFVSQTLLALLRNKKRIVGRIVGRTHATSISLN